MSLNAWEKQALDSIKDGLAGSDPDLAALLSAFTRLATGKDTPDTEQLPAGSRRALRRLRRARRSATMRRVYRGLGFQRVALLLWLLATAVIIAVALALNHGGGHATCTGTLATVCTHAVTGHSPGAAPPGTAASPAPQQPAAAIPQAGP